MVTDAAVPRWGKPEEMAELLAFCAGEKAGYPTGTDISNDGGVVASMRERAWSPPKPADRIQLSPAATNDVNRTCGLSSANPCSRHLVVNSASSTPSVRVSTSIDTCFCTNSASAGSMARATV